MRSLYYFAGPALVLVALAAACSSASTHVEPRPTKGDAGSAEDGESYPATYLAAEPQRSGDATKGYHALVNEPYVPCGIPDSAYKRAQPTADPGDLLDGRDGRNATLPTTSRP